MEFLRLIILGWYRRYYRIIRVGAGNSALHLKYMYLKPVYPHWRGELVSLPGISITGSGLPPLARGTRGIPGASSQRKRFTPAGAGNSCPGGCAGRYGTVYPRWRGELSSSAVVDGSPGGLPPLARGTRANVRLALLLLSVYPRWRGELRFGAGVEVIMGGLPPLARGTRR